MDSVVDWLIVSSAAAMSIWLIVFLAIAMCMQIAAIFAWILWGNWQSHKEHKAFRAACAESIRANEKRMRELYPQIKAHFGHAPEPIDAERIIASWP